jgi:heme/copper-type cytochrome/quinol oxidase subunit 3
VNARSARDIDVSTLAEQAIGHRDPLWWGTASFILIEGSTILVCLASYFYLWRNEPHWPPPPIPYPGVLLPTVGVIVALLSVLPAAWSAREGRRMNSDGARAAMLLHSLFGIALLVLRGFEFTQLGTRWYGTAYGSVVWMTLGVHTTVVLTDVADTFFATAIFVTHREQAKHFAGLVDNALYWYFVVASWIVVYGVIFVAPRFM